MSKLNQFQVIYVKLKNLQSVGFIFGTKRMTKINWHRLFGLTLMNLLSDSPYQVELEKEVSLKKQFLDVVIVRKNAEVVNFELPIGLENLAEHNLLSYKSLRESFDDWAIEELIGYYSNYRKIASPSLDKLLPIEQFKLYAISTRYPANLLNDKIEFQKIQHGVFDLTWGSRMIRLIVLSQIELAERNAFWLLFSGKAQEFVFADQHYHWHSPKERAVLNQLYELYKHEGVVMPYTMEDFNRDFTEAHLHLLPPEKRLKGLPSETVLRQFSLEERLKGLSIEEIQAYLATLKEQN